MAGRRSRRARSVEGTSRKLDKETLDARTPHASILQIQPDVEVGQRFHQRIDSHRTAVHNQRLLTISSVTSQTNGVKATSKTRRQHHCAAGPPWPDIRMRLRLDPLDPSWGSEYCSHPLRPLGIQRDELDQLLLRDHRRHIHCYWGGPGFRLGQIESFRGLA